MTTDIGRGLCGPSTTQELLMVTIPSKAPVPEPKAEPTPEPPQFVPRCCLYCDITIFQDEPAHSWHVKHQRDNMTTIERTFSDSTIGDATPWLESLHP